METQTSCALEKVLTEMPALTLEELEQVEKAIRQAKSHLIFSADPAYHVDRILFEAGLINEPTRLSPRRYEIEPIQVLGEPLSETLIRERR